MKSELLTNSKLLFGTLGVLFAAWLIKVVIKGYRVRIIFSELQKLGMPMPKHNKLLGHLLAVKLYVDKLPLDAHEFLGVGQIARNYPGGIFYLDMWPFVDGPLMVVTSVTAATEATQKTILATKKPASLTSWFHPISGGPNLFTMANEEWKLWRNTFNSGFSQGHILKLVPNIVHEAQAYRNLLHKHAERNEMFLLDEQTLWFTMDMIGAIVLESNLNSERTRNPLAVALLSQLRWKVSGREPNPFVRINPVRKFVEWHNSRIMNSYIGTQLDKRYKEYCAKLSRGEKHDSKSVVSLVLEGYLKQNSLENPSLRLDRTFRNYATYQIRTFLFAGHDSTSSTICHIYYLLSKNSTAMQKLRQEHDTLVSTDISAIGAVISSNPQVLNQMTYTLAVIKEAMRLFPPATGMRDGAPGVNIHDDQGTAYPTDDCMVWILHQAMHRRPAYWPSPDDFIPERWLASPGDSLYPVKGAWRPFEHGPRNCIGQGLVMLELKIILALTIREFDVRDAYEEFDRLHAVKGDRIKRVEGERAYQIEQGGAHPADRFPCRVSFLK